MSRRDRDLAREISAALQDSVLEAALPKATGLAAAMRKRAVSGFPGYEDARRRAREIKERAIEELPELLEQLEESVAEAGGVVHHAADAGEACQRVVEIARQESVRRVVKSKSMTTEEIDLNDALEAAGIHVRETDLGEYIVQLDRDRPSHIIAPIIHKDLEDVRRVFRAGLGLDEVPERPEELTQLARQRLRQEFFDADMGITGANFLLADSGTLVLVENEGNVRLCTQLPRVHVAVAGIEKVIPGLAELQPFIELLPRSATGQLLTSYLSFISGPGWSASPLVDGPRRFHLVLVDNGRMAMRDDDELREALYCIRCGACLNVCTPYTAVGGHVYGGPTYQSGIGNAWEAGVEGLGTAAQFNALCSGCSRCRDVCPVHIDIPWMNAVIRDRVRRRDGDDRSGLVPRLLEDPPSLYRLVARAAPLDRWLGDSAPVRWGLERFAGLDRRRSLPAPAREDLVTWHRRRGGTVIDAVATARATARRLAGGEAGDGSEEPDLFAGDAETASRLVVLWADCHTERLEPGVGRAATRVLERMGFEVLLVAGPCCGRAALSQGNLDRSREQADGLLDVLEPLATAGLPVVGLEPSCASCLVEEHGKLLPGDERWAAVRSATRELLEFVEAEASRLDLAATAPEAEDAPARTVVVHGHCQQKTAGWFPATVALLERLPRVKVQTTTAECCGMAGSYGYKVLTYPVSLALGERLAAEIERIEELEADGVEEVLACGISCRSQLADVAGRYARHPVELLDELLAATEDEEIPESG